MNRSYQHFAARLFVLAVIAAAAAQPCDAAIESRDILKTYFETGDIPTQEQFKDVIDSALNLVDDGLVSYSSRDSSGGAPRLDEGALVGPGMPLFPVTDVPGFSPDWLGESGFLPLAYEQDSQLHYAYLQISSPVPGAPNPYSMLVEYLVYETDPNTALLTQSVPEPSTLILCLAALAGLLAWRRR